MYRYLVLRMYCVYMYKCIEPIEWKGFVVSSVFASDTMAAVQVPQALCHEQQGQL